MTGKSIFGARKLKSSRWMKRGLELESSVLKKVEKLHSITLQETGLWILSQFPVIGASPDGMNEEFVAEIKCPSSQKRVGEYITKEGCVAPKFMAQVQLQMFVTGRKKGLFCFADPDYERNGKVRVIPVFYDESFPSLILAPAICYWKKAIFPKLWETCED